jgi:ABC-type branched-subunit amino acid transport system substrate-binding protein
MSGEYRFVLRLSAAEDGLDPAELEELVLQLRRDLLDAGVSGLQVQQSGPAPEGTRAAELIAAGLAIVVNGLSTAAAAAQVAEFIRNWRSTHARRRGLAVDVDAAPVSPSTAAVAARPESHQRSALLVANASYSDPALRQLRSPVPDVQALADVLGDPAIGGFEVSQLIDGNETAVRRAVAAFFADRDQDDLLLLHFSCHGLKDQQGRLFLAFADTELRSLSATGLPAGFIADQMSQTASRRVVLILDCCYSGAFARGVSVRGDRSVHIAEEFGDGTGRIVLTASSATEYSFEGGQLSSDAAQPSVFTNALVTGLRTGAADLDGDGDVSVDELYDYAYRQVRTNQPGQEPRKWIFGMAGGLIIARSKAPARLPESVVTDLESERVVLRLEAVSGLAALLSGAKPGLRDAAAKALAKLRENDDSVRVRDAAAAVLASSPAAAASRSQAGAPATQATTTADSGTPAGAPPSTPQAKTTADSRTPAGVPASTTQATTTADSAKVTGRATTTTAEGEHASPALATKPETVVTPKPVRTIAAPRSERKRWWRRGPVWLPVALIAVVALSYAAYRLMPHGPGGSAGSPTLTIGFYGDLTGDKVWYAESARRAAEMAVAEYNDRRGSGPKLELVAFDSTNVWQDISAGRTGRKLIGVIGPATSPQSSAVMPTFEANGIPTISVSATDPALRNRGWRYWHRIVADDDAQRELLAGYLTTTAKVKRGYTIDYGFGETADNAGQIAIRLKQAGAAEVVQDRISQGGSVGEIVQRITEYKPDVVVQYSDGPDVSAVLRQLREAGSQTLFVVNEGVMSDQAFLRGAGSWADDALIATSFALPATGASQAMNAFTERYRQRYSNDPGPYAAEAYDAAIALIQAVEAGKATSDDVATYLSSNAIVGTLRTIQFNTQGENLAASEFLYRVKNGILVTAGVAATR